MKGRLPACLLVLALMGVATYANGPAFLGPPIPTSPVDAPPIATTALTLPQTAGRTFLGSPNPTPAVAPTALSLLFAAPDARPLVTAPPADTPPFPGRFWVNAEVLLWWMKSANLPPLVTASPAGTAVDNVGVLGAPGAQVLFGGPVNGDLTLGGRLTAGYWFDCERTCGIEAYYFQLGSRTERSSAGTPGNVGRPFFNTFTGAPDAQLVSFPAVTDGIVEASASSGSLLGAGVLARHNLCCGCWYRLDALVGYRFLSLNDNVGITENLISSDPAQIVAPLGTNIIVIDHFHTSNRFHGGDIGLAGEMRWNAWTLGATARIAFGATRERVDISGSTTITVPGFAPVANAGGLLALSSNSGTYTRDVFAVVPEVRLQLGYDLNARTRVHVGYNFLYWSRVARAGDQIDLVVNPALLPPPTPGATPLRPAFSFGDTSFWAQGMNVGIEFRF
jgi:hypothetical protein